MATPLKNIFSKSKSKQIDVKDKISPLPNQKRFCTFWGGILDVCIGVCFVVLAILYLINSINILMPELAFLQDLALGYTILLFIFAMCLGVIIFLIGLSQIKLTFSPNYKYYLNASFIVGMMIFEFTLLLLMVVFALFFSWGELSLAGIIFAIVFGLSALLKLIDVIIIREHVSKIDSFSE